MSKAAEIYDVLQKELINGVYKPGSKFASEHKLMLRFKSSRITINKVTEHLVTEGLIKRGPKGAGTFVSEIIPFPIGHLAYLGSILSPYHTRILKGIQFAAFQKNYAVSVFSPDTEFTSHVLEKIRCSSFRGLMVSNIGLVPENFPIPVVYVDNGYKTEQKARASVTCSNYRGAVELAESLIAHGHREILIFTNHSDLEPSRNERVAGFKDTMEKHGIHNVPRRFFHETIIDFASIKFLLKKILKQFPETTAIMTDSDILANHLRQGIREIMPERKICITGFGNLTFDGGGTKYPSVEQHPEEIGLQSVNELLHMIDDPGYVPAGRIEVETELVNLDKMAYIR